MDNAQLALPLNDPCHQRAMADARGAAARAELELEMAAATEADAFAAYFASTFSGFRAAALARLKEARAASRAALKANNAAQSALTAAAARLAMSGLRPQ